MPSVPDSLVFEDVVRHFGLVRVLDGVSGTAGPGEILVVGGANGSGKSTLLRCLAGLLRQQAGRIELRLGGATLDIAERRLRVGYVAPDLAFYEPLTARENLVLFAKLRGVPAARAERLLEETGVPTDRWVRALSSGQRQRLRWAWALLHEPPLLLLDEPFQNLDPEGEATLRERLRRHREGGGLTVVASPSGIGLDGPLHRLDLSNPVAAGGGG